VLHYFDRLRQAGVEPSAHSYKLLLDAYACLPPLDPEAVEQTFAALCADPNIVVQGTHWASMITAYGLYGGNVDKAVEIFESIPTHPTTTFNVANEPVIWEAIFTVLANKGVPEQLDAMRQRMIDLGARSTAYVYNVLITGYARAGQIEKSRAIYNSMGDSVTGVAAPNNHPVLLTSSGHVKPSTTTVQPTEVVYREPSTYEAMIRAELRAGDRNAAEWVLARMEERRYPVAVYMKAKAILEEKSEVDTKAEAGASEAAPDVAEAYEETRYNGYDRTHPSTT